MTIAKYVLLIVIVISCNTKNNNIQVSQNLDKIDRIQNIDHSVHEPLSSRVKTPDGFIRRTIDSGSFKSFLRNIELKPSGAKVKYFNGTTKASHGVYTDVVNLDIGAKDLHQCADAIMRLKAEYLWNTKQYEAIHFNFTNGFRVDYSHWMNGRRIKVNGNHVEWVDSRAPSNTYKDFWSYMESIFTYAGTASLEKELTSVDYAKMEIGDVLIQGGFPGHAVIVMDMAINESTGEELFLLAQSYMPAQEIQILINPKDENLSPWYSLKQGTTIETPEWSFYKTDLKRF